MERECGWVTHPPGDAFSTVWRPLVEYLVDVFVAAGNQNAQGGADGTASVEGSHVVSPSFSVPRDTRRDVYRHALLLGYAVLFVVGQQLRWQQKRHEVLAVGAGDRQRAGARGLREAHVRQRLLQHVLLWSSEVVSGGPRAGASRALRADRNGPWLQSCRGRTGTWQQRAPRPWATSRSCQRRC